MARFEAYSSFDINHVYFWLLNPGEDPISWGTGTTEFAGVTYRAAVGYYYYAFDNPEATLLGGADLGLDSAANLTGTTIQLIQGFTGDFSSGTPIYSLVANVPVSLFNDAVYSRVESTSVFSEALKGDDVIELSSENDVMSGYAGADRINGYAGNDSLYGGDGNDRIWGGAGYDFISGDAGNDIISGGVGIDTASYASAGAAVAVNLGISVAQDTLGGGIDRLTSIENLVGSGFADQLTGNKGANGITGGGGDDTLIGLEGSDVLAGGDGNDLLDGGVGADTASYSDSSARVVVKLGIVGAQKTGGGGTDTLVSIENAFGSDYDDKIVGSDGANIIWGGAGADSIAGGDGNDKLYGSYGPGFFADGRNVLNGGAGNDLLVGAFNPDTLVGGTGNDTLVGQEDSDSLTGGTGADRFVLAYDLYSGTDLIVDFSAKQHDKIALSLAKNTDDAFAFAAGAGGKLTADEFYSAAGATNAQDASDRIIYDSTTGALYYDPDGNLAGGIDAFQIAQLGSGTTHPALTLADFVIVA